METNLTYELTNNEHVANAKEIENESVSVDVLVQKVKRASELLLIAKQN